MSDNITDFHYGEDVQLTLVLKDRPIPPALVGEPLTDAATQAISFVISDALTGVTLYEATTAVEIVLADAATAKFDADFNRTNLMAVLSAETDYHYDVWSTSASDVRLHQKSGVIRLGPSTLPA